MARRAKVRGRGPKLVSIRGGAGMSAEQRSNVSDETRREFLERGRIALLVAEEKKQEYRSAHGIYTQVLKEAKRAGVTQVSWTLAMLKRDPLDIAAEIKEQNRMLVIAQIPVGVQLGMFEGVGETLAEVLERQGGLTAAEATQATWEKEDDAKLHEIVRGQGEPKPSEGFTPDEQQAAYLAKVAQAAQAKVNPPQPKPDEEEDEDEEDEEQEEEEEQKVAGNEVLERSVDDQAAYKQGERAFQLGRTLEGCPYSSITSMSGAWIRGWRAKEAEQKVSA